MNGRNVAIMQPYIFPYIGYFHLIQASSIFVFYDDVNFIKGGWINRNRILFLRRHTKGIHKLSWILFYMFLTIPKNVIKYSLRMEFYNLKAFLEAIYWNLSNWYKPK